MTWRPHRRAVYRPKFAYQIDGDSVSRVYLNASSEWLLFRALRDISRAGKQLAWLECNEHRLTPRSLAGLNVYLRTRAMLAWKSPRADKCTGRELIGSGEWAKFCRMLGLKFEGKGVRFVA